MVEVGFEPIIIKKAPLWVRPYCKEVDVEEEGEIGHGEVSIEEAQRAIISYCSANPSTCLEFVGYFKENGYPIQSYEVPLVDIHSTDELPDGTLPPDGEEVYELTQVNDEGPPVTVPKVVGRGEDLEIEEDEELSGGELKREFKQALGIFFSPFSDEEDYAVALSQLTNVIEQMPLNSTQKTKVILACRTVLYRDFENLYVDALLILRRLREMGVSKKQAADINQYFQYAEAAHDVTLPGLDDIERVEEEDKVVEAKRKLPPPPFYRGFPLALQLLADIAFTGFVGVDIPEEYIHADLAPEAQEVSFGEGIESPFGVNSGMGFKLFLFNVFGVGLYFPKWEGISSSEFWEKEDCGREFHGKISPVVDNKSSVFYGIGLRTPILPYAGGQVSLLLFYDYFWMGKNSGIPLRYISGYQGASDSSEICCVQDDFVFATARPRLHRFGATFTVRIFLGERRPQSITLVEFSAGVNLIDRNVELTSAGSGFIEEDINPVGAFFQLSMSVEGGNFGYVFDW